MKHILVLAYQCSPSRGSEYSVAWNYVIHMAKYHKLTVLYGTSGEHMGDNREMEEYLGEHVHPNMEFVYVKPSRWTNALNWFNRHGLLCYSFYFAYKAWHKQAYSVAQKIIAEKKIDIVHFVGPIGYREPGYLWKLDKPYIWGSVGGVSNYPVALIPSMSTKTLLKHQVRASVNNYQFRHSRCLKKALAHCDVFLTATTETQDSFREVWGKDSILLPENGIVSDVRLNERKFHDIKKIKLISIGSIDGRKNVRLLLEVLRLLPCKDKIDLHIVGDGPEKGWLENFSKENGLSDVITWHGRKEHEEVLELLNKSHLHIITSLNEGNPTTIWEAMSTGVPTLTLDHCGMHDTICEECGFKVDISSYDQVIADIVTVLNRCIDHPEILREKALGAVSCARKYLWKSREELFLKCYDQAIEEHNK